MAQEEFEVVISYVPLPDEVVPENYFHTDATHVYLIPPNRDADAILLAEELSTRFNNLRTVVLIPGQAFDATGTRHGRGGGWYDRFLNSIPATWTRIGFCYDNQFSTETLERESWDEPVDVVCVVNRETSEDTKHETHARAAAA